MNNEDRRKYGEVLKGVVQELSRTMECVSSCLIDLSFNDSSCFSAIKERIFLLCSLISIASVMASSSAILVLKMSNTTSNLSLIVLSFMDVLVKKDFFANCLCSISKDTAKISRSLRDKSHNCSVDNKPLLV